MHKDNRKNIYSQEIEYSYLTLISKKLRIGIIGGGKAGTIKAKHFVNNKCYVEVLSETFDKEVIELAKNNAENLMLINKEFSLEFLRDKHIVIIAVSNEILKNRIKNYCDENYKIYIDSSDFTQGMGVVPIQKSTENITFALNTKQGNPKGAALLSNNIKKLLEEYDDFIKFTGVIRKKAKELPNYKRDIVTIINSEEFKKSFDEGKSEKVLRNNFPKEIVDYILEF